MQHPLSILKQYFGYENFRSHQEKAIENTLNGKDTFVLMPTGGGKSLCYQVPALCMGGTAIVISPLIALMKDQVDALRANGVAAAYLNSTLSQVEENELFQQLQNGQLKLLYIAPERLSSNAGAFYDFLNRIPISLFAIDEAHCVSHWGHDFRPDYLFLNELKTRFPKIPVIALTASADEITREDIVLQLRLDQPEVLVASFDRPNIYYFIRPKQDMYAQIIEYIKGKSNESGIIYCLSRKGTEEMTGLLRDNGIEAKYYHAGMPSHERSKVQEGFIKDKIQVIVATIAFGMGIDKSNIRFVLHADLPKNIESYYQETGRAGRDGLRSDVVLFFSPGDVMKLQRFAMVEGNPAQSQLMLKKLRQMVDFAESRHCRRKYLMRYFGEAHQGNCNSCDYCLSDFETVDITVEAQKILSAVSRLGERFGKTMVVDLLRGAQSEKMKPWMRDLPTYGIGKGHAKQFWMDVIRHLLQNDFLKEEYMDQYQILKLTDNSTSILSGMQKVTMEVIENNPPSNETPFKSNAYASMNELPIDKTLFELLRVTRTKHAEEENVPPYVILSDASLNEMAIYFPQTLLELRQISGVGDFKLEKYGASFLDTINPYCRQQNIESKIHLKKPKAEPKKITSSKLHEIGSTFKKSYDLHKAGHDIEEIAAIRALHPNTILDHLSHYISNGEIKAADLMDPLKIPIILKVLEEKGPASLKVIKESLDEDFTYEEIKCVMALWRTEK